MTIFRWVIVTLVFLQLQGCAATVYRWRDLPADSEELSRYSEQEKQAYYEKFGIASMEGSGFSTFAEPDKKYDLDTFFPIVQSLVPDAEQHYETVDNISTIGAFGWLISYAFFAVYTGVASGEALNYSGNNSSGSESSNLEQNIWVIILTNTIIYLAVEISRQYVTDYFREAEYEKLRLKYNAALRKQLQLEPSNLSTLIPEPTLAVSP